MRFCSEGGCSGIAMTGDFCDVHKDPANRKERNQNTPRHPMDAWYRRQCWKGRHGVRAMKIRRNPTCELCGRPATDVHHTQPWKDTENWFVFMGGIDMEFLQSLCKKCHAAITMKEMMNGTSEGNNKCSNQL